MTINRWGVEAQGPLAISADSGAQTGPVVTDLAGAEFAVAWIDGNLVRLKFYDEQGNVNPLLQQVTLTDGVGTNISNLAIAAGGSDMGYGVAWTETNSGVEQLKLRYYDNVAGAVLGPEIAISTHTTINQHDLEIAGYGKDDARGRPIVDGFDAVWVEGNGGAHALGEIIIQRFAVPLDAKKDPSGPPVAAGIDGTVGAGADTQLTVAVSGRDPSVAGLFAHVGGANETVVTWVDASNNINIRVYNDNGTVSTGLAGVAAANVATAARPLAAGAQQHVAAIQGGSFVVAWISDNGGDHQLVYRVFTVGAAGGTWTAGPVQVADTLNGPADGITDFSIATLDTDGFAISWSSQDFGTQAVFSRTFTSAGIPNEAGATAFHAPLDATVIDTSGIIANRFVAVYQDNSGDGADIGARILDPRSADDGSPILNVNDPGVTLIGDPDFETRGRTDRDVLVGTVGQDFIDGRQADDIMDGGLGDDTFRAGGGNDVIDGGGGNDTLILTGRYTLGGDAANNDYLIQYLGNSLFQITDNRANGDGADSVRSIENFQFLGSGTNYTLNDLIGVHNTQITPTAWGWTDEDGDTTPNANQIPDVDGFFVASDTRAGIQRNATVADSVGEFIAVVWEESATLGADTHIKARFFDVVLNADGFIPNTFNVSDGIGIETNAVVASGGANSGWGFAWEQLDDALDTSHELRTNFVGPGQLTGPEISVFVEGPNVDQHDAAIFGSFLDRTLADPVGGSALPTGMSDGHNVIWVSTHLDGVDGAMPDGYGRIMMQRFEVPLDALGNPGASVAGGIDGIAGLDNAYGTLDSAFWLGDEDANGTGGFFGRNPMTSSLHTQETAMMWIAEDGLGGEKVMFRALDDLGVVIDFPAGNNISIGYPVAAGTNALMVSAGAVQLAIVWVTEDNTSPSGYTVMGTYLSSAGNGLNGEGFGFGMPANPFVLAQLPAGFDPANSNLQLTGLSGEDSNDVVIGWNMPDAATGSGDDFFAQHVAVIIDPVTGIALSMQPEGDAIRINAETAGDQNQVTMAGLLGERFVAVYTDNNGSYTDGSDLIARVIDTRDAVDPEPIIGDNVRPDGRIQARRDVLVGTNGNDNIRGDILENDGLVDWIFGGMGDDVIQGGPGITGAAGTPEIIDGGEGDDTAVYTGRLQDYAISVTGDGGIEVIDLRPQRDNNGNQLNHDGIDNLLNIEHIRFLDLSNGGASAQTITFGFPGTPPPVDPSWIGTPVAWSLDDTSIFKEVTVDIGAGDAGNPATIVVTNLQDGAAAVWTVNGTEVWAISYDTTGKPDPVLLGVNTQLTDGGPGGIWLDNTVGRMDVAMTAGLGMTAVWESTDNAGDDSGDTSLHLSFASTATHFVLDAAGGVPGPGLPGGEIVVVGTEGAGVALDPTIQGYEIVNSDNDTLEVGFHVGFEVKDGDLDTTVGDNYGALMLARYEIPVYDLAVDGAGNVVLDANGQGVLATDANGNLVPSTTATFGTGSEEGPISIGLDGLRGTADDNVAIAITDQGLFAANNIPVGANVLQGRDLTMGSLHDGQLVVSYVGPDEQVHLLVYLPSIDQVGDRELNPGNAGSDIVATGITTYSAFTVPFPTAYGAVSANSTAMTVAQQNGSFGVFWGEDDGAGTITIKGIIYSGAGSNWSPSAITTFATGLPVGVDFDIAASGVTPGGLEDGFFISWESAGAGIHGQRFNMAGEAVGNQIVVGDPTSGTPGAHSSSGIDDGRMIVGYVDGDDVSVQFLDNRQSGVPLIGPRTGAPADVIVGTVGDDSIDGRARADQLFGGLGDDLLSLGSDEDIGFGGMGDDTIIGGSGQDQLLGEEGDDLLWGGISGPIGRVDRDLVTGLTAAGVSAALIASDPGADLISGGDGNDTISFQGEFGSFDINLQTGIATGDRTSLHNLNSTILEDVIGAIVDDGAGGTIFQFTHDVENIRGGLGDDRLTGDGGDNVLDGGEGNNTYIGGGGTDTVIVHGVFSTYAFTRTGNTITISDAEDTQTITDVDFIQFEDRRVLVSDIFAVLNSGQTAQGSALAVADINHAPVARNDAAVVVQGGATMIKVLANDTDVDAGQVLHVTQINGVALGNTPVDVANGKVSLLANGALAFTANPTYAGPTSFAYTITDDNGATSTATVYLQVATPGDPNVDNGVAAIAIAGVAEAGNELSVVLGADPDGMAGAPAYQWLRNGATIGGATNATYTVTGGDTNAIITVRASYTDAEGHASIVTSAGTQVIDAVNDGAATVSISGLAIEHETLTASITTPDPDGEGTAPAYQWLRDGATISGATGDTYTLATGDVGHAITVRAVYTDAQGFNESVAASPVGPITGVDDGDASLTISGVTTVNAVLTAVFGAVPDPDGNGSVPPTYQWLRNGIAIDSATASTYTLTALDLAAAISVTATYTDGQGFAEFVTSNATAPIHQQNFALTGAPTIDDTTPREGQVLSANTSAIADPNGVGTKAYQWQSSTNGSVWTNISGATAATYQVAGAPGVGLGPLADKLLRVVVSYTDGDGYAESVASAATSPVGIQWNATANPVGVTFSGTGGDDQLLGTAFNDNLSGLGGDDIIQGRNGNDTVNGGAGNDDLQGNAGNDVLIGGSGNDQLNGGAGFDTAVFSGQVTSYVLNTNGASPLVITDTVGTDGTDSLIGMEAIQFGATTYTMVLDANGPGNVNGGAGSQIIFGRGGFDTLHGGDASDILVGGLGRDMIYGDAGDDFIFQAAATDGRDFVDGGDGTDTYILMGSAASETFHIWTRQAAWDAGIRGLAANTEIVITLNGDASSNIIAELDNIEEIKINSVLTTVNDGDGKFLGGDADGDTIIVTGDFTTTSLDYSTIRFAGTGGNDTVDITSLTSAHRVVFESNGGTDTILGQVRTQDVFNGSGFNDERTAAAASTAAATTASFGVGDGVDALLAGLLRHPGSLGSLDAASADAIGLNRFAPAGGMSGLDDLDALLLHAGLNGSHDDLGHAMIDSITDHLPLELVELAAPFNLAHDLLGGMMDQVEMRHGVIADYAYLPTS